MATGVLPVVKQTDARRRASAKFHQKRLASGLTKTTIWLSKDAREALQRLKDRFGSQDAATEAALMEALKQIERDGTSD